MKSPKRWNILAVVLIVLGVGATLGGVFGQVFLAEDDGHHDDREPTFALESQVGADELVVEQVAPNSLAVEVERAGQPLGLDEIHDGRGGIFIVGADGSYFAHVAPGGLDPVAGQTAGVASLSVPPGETRVIAQVAADGGPDLLELGVTVDVTGEPVEPQNIVDTDEWTNGSITVTRQSFDFVLSAPWNGDDVYEGPAFLTLVRAEDFAFTHAHAELVGDNRFSFASDLPGLGDYLAALEFEQDGDLVTALFRFTL